MSQQLTFDDILAHKVLHNLKYRKQGKKTTFGSLVWHEKNICLCGVKYFGGYNAKVEFIWAMDRWIMSCISVVTYSYVLNGKLVRFEIE